MSNVNVRKGHSKHAHARTHAQVREYPQFPSLLISAGDEPSQQLGEGSALAASSGGLTPQGAFAEAQAEFLEPDANEVRVAPLRACLPSLMEMRGHGTAAPQPF